MRQAGREIPKAAFIHICDIGTARLVDGGYPTSAVSHVGPFGSEMPMQLADPAPRQPHINAGDFLGNLEVVLSDLPRPAAVLYAPGRVVERGPEERQIADIGCRWREGTRKRV